MSRFFLLIIYFALIHYYGYDADASLYLLQTIHFLQPDRFVNDVPFMFGNQGGYSLFNPLCAVFFNLFSVNNGGVVFTLLLQLNAALALSLFIKTFADSFPYSQKQRFIMTGVAIFLYSQACYGCGDSLSMPILEPLLVARLASQVSVLWGLVFFISKKNCSLVFFLLSTALHPLTGGWSIPFWLLFYYKKWTVPIITFGLLFPLSGFLHRGALDFVYDDWLVRPLYIVPSVNDLLKYASVLSILAVLMLKLKDLDAKKMSKSLFVIGSIAIYWQIAGSFFEHVFLYQVQPFRVMWLCMIMLAPLLWIFFKELMSTVEPNNSKLLALSAVLGIQVFSANNNPKVAIIAIALLFAITKIVASMNFKHVCSSILFLLIGIITIFECARDFNSFSFVFSVFDYLTILEALPYLKEIVFLFSILLFVHHLFIRKPALAILFLLCACIKDAEILTTIGIALMYSNQLSSFMRKLFHKKEVWAALSLLILTYVFVSWDARDDYRLAVETEMDRYLEKNVFSDVHDRGKIFFFVDGERPICSRYRFLTGGYIDQTIHVGETFFYEHYKEATRRKNMIISGKNSYNSVSQIAFNDRLNHIYDNLDSLNDCLNTLCRKQEIGYIVTDRKDITGIVVDSSFVGEQKEIYLKKCPL